MTQAGHGRVMQRFQVFVAHGVHGEQVHTGGSQRGHVRCEGVRVSTYRGKGYVRHRAAALLGQEQREADYPRRSRMHQ